MKPGASGRWVELAGLAAWSAAGVCAAADLARIEPAAAGFDPARLAAIDGLVAEALEQGKMPGCVVCIGRGGGICRLEAHGRRALEPAAEPMSVDTVFDLASLTKPVATATALMQLVEEGKVRLADTARLGCPSRT